jgi:hypothetical protein
MRPRVDVRTGRGTEAWWQGIRARLRARRRTLVATLRQARAKARIRPRTEIALYALVLSALLLAVALDIGRRRLGGVLFLVVLLAVHAFARKRVPAGVATARKEGTP